MSDMPVATTGTAVMASTVTSSVTLVSMSPDGSAVCIDWPEVERQAQGRDPFLMPLARALLAVRDKTDQPMPGR